MAQNEPTENRINIRSKKNLEEENKLEIAAREQLLRRLERTLKLLNNRANVRRKNMILKERALRGEYRTVDEAHEAYGYGFISEKQYKEIAEAIENKDEEIAALVFPEQAAASILFDFMRRLMNEIEAFKFELLPPEEQSRILDEREAARRQKAGGDT